MKRVIGLFLSAVMMFTLITAVSATGIVFVATDGLDSNDGSLSAPFATLQAAVDAVPDGGTVYMREGTYSAGARLSKSVAIKGYNGEKVVFSASQKGTPVSASAEERKLIEDSEARTKVSYLEGIERIGEVRTDGVSHALLIDGEYRRSASLFDINVAGMTFEKTDKQDDGRFEYIGSIDIHEYGMKTYLEGYVTGSLGGKDFVSEYKVAPGVWELSVYAPFDGEMEYEVEPHGKIYYTYGNIWFEYNVAFINKPGEWATENGKVYLYPEKDVKEIEYLADYETYITAEDINGIKISGIEFSKTLGNAVNLKKCNDAVVSGCVFKNITDTAVVMEECENAKIFNCEFECNAARCIEFKNTDNSIIDNCGFENNAVLCRYDVPYIVISGDSNTLSRSEMVTSPCGAVEISGNSNTVTGCRIENSSNFDSSAAISITDVSIDSIITGNHISGNRKAFMGAVYQPWYNRWESLEYASSDALKTVDYVKLGISSEPAMAVAISKKASGTKIFNNVVNECNNAVNIIASDSNEITNNVFFTDQAYLTIEEYTDKFTGEEFVPENNNIHGNILCDQEDIVSVFYKDDGNVFENNIKIAHSNALERDGRIKLDNITKKIPEFENINFDAIGRYEVAEEPEDALPETPVLTKDDGKIKVLLNGKAIDFADVAPQIINDRTMVPLRAIFEALGASVEWDDATKTVTAVKGDVTVKMTIGADSFLKNDESVALDSPATIIDSRTLVPVRAIAEAFGSQVGWIAESKTVNIED